MGNDSHQSKSNPEHIGNDGGYGSEGQGSPGFQAGWKISHFPFKESDNNNSTLNNYSVENESLQENSGRTKYFTGLTLNNDENNISRDGVFDEESKPTQKSGENFDLELLGYQGVKSYIDNKEDILSLYKMFDNIGNKKEFQQGDYMEIKLLANLIFYGLVIIIFMALIWIVQK